jgi:predicted Mrr-cat superfamily restriction endonuclease
MNCWFWNIDLNARKYINEELQKHHLRQGWGYDDKLDLRKLNDKVASKTPLDPDEQVAWSRCWYMLSEIKVGDLVAVKNVPDRDKFTIVKVTGPYDFTNEAHEDYEHVLPVEIVGVYHKQSEFVPTTLVNALNRERNPIRVTYKHKQAVCDLASKVTDTTPEERAKPEQFKEKVTKWQSKLLTPLKKALQADLSHKETERLILEMLKRDGMDVVWNAGPGEQGADLLGDPQIGYGIPYKLAIQVKMHWEQDNDQTGIDQLERAIAAHGVQAGLLGPDLKKRIEESKKKYNIQVVYGEDLFVRLLELIADSSLDLTD